MSCLCKKYHLLTRQPGCPCDSLTHPQPPAIPAGLGGLPRQTATFPEFRRAMLAAIRQYPELAGWRARGEDDLGVMLLEMWAYLCDNLSFYDEVIANEAYLRTARRPPSLRRLVQLLGYQPRPAVAATVKLAAMAEGRQPVKLPKGTAFMSGAFGDEPPQSFELDEARSIHPLANRWEVEPPRIRTYGEWKKRAQEIEGAPGYDSILIDRQRKIDAGAVLFLRHQKNAKLNQVVVVEQVTPYTGADNQRYDQVFFRSKLTLPDDTFLSELQLLVPGQAVGIERLNYLFGVLVPMLIESAIYTGSTESNPEKASIANFSLAGHVGTLIANKASSSAPFVDFTILQLSGNYGAIHPDDFVLLSRSAEYRWFQVTKTQAGQREILRTVTVNRNTFEVPGTPSPYTDVYLDRSINDPIRRGASTDLWGPDVKDQLQLHFALEDAGPVIGEAYPTLSDGDLLRLKAPVEKPVDEYASDSFFLWDKNKRGLEIGGTVRFEQRRLEKNTEERWDPGLILPVTAYGNVLPASRGQTVRGEILGSGDASLPNQSFQLGRKPLTYLAAPMAGNDSGLVSTLVIYVDGIRWREVPSFFGQGPDEAIYIVRHNDEEEARITFGDGRRGHRLPTGRNNIVADYRYGAGAAGPPAGSINQILKPVTGLGSVVNPVAVRGGADRETPEAIRDNAPQSALILGRAVSILDMEAVARTVPGIKAVQGQWHWHATQQRAVVHLWYIGDEGLETTISERLRHLAGPSTPIGVQQANGIAVFLELDLDIDPRFREEEVITQVQDTLWDEKSGLLAPANQAVGRPFYRSRLMAAVHQAPGVRSVRSCYWNQAPFTQFARSAPAGAYFDFAAGGLLVNDVFRKG